MKTPTPKKRILRRGLWWSDTTRTWHYEFKYGGQPRKGDTGHVLEKSARDWIIEKKKTIKNAEVGILPPPGPALTLAQALAEWRQAIHPRACECLSKPWAAPRTSTSPASSPCYIHTGWSWGWTESVREGGILPVMMVTPFGGEVYTVRRFLLMIFVSHLNSQA